ncbi:MAG: alpha/beta hydrolase family protein [Solirubrobacteraceae bacterium]
MHEEATLYSGGAWLPVLLDIPDRRSGGPYPTVVLAHGLANDRDEGAQFPPLAGRLRDAGYLVMRFDFRGGARSVDPGRMLVGSQWPHDLLAAVTWIRRHPAADPARVSVVGASWGGGVAIHVAAAEPTLRCLVTLGTPAAGERWLRELWTAGHGEDGWHAFQASVLEDRARRAAGEPSRRVRLAAGLLAVPAAELDSVEAFIAAHPGMVAELPLEVADDLLLFAPERSAPAVRCPVRVLHGTADDLVSPREAAAYGRALGARADVMPVAGGVHQLLLGNTREEVIEAVVEWLTLHQGLVT